jgi:hypothetical protein
MRPLSLYYLEFDDGRFCDVQSYEPLSLDEIRPGMCVEVVISYSPWKTTLKFINKKVASVVKLPGGYRDQFIYE